MTTRFLPPWQRLLRAWRDWRELDGTPTVAPDLPPEEGAQVEALMAECLAARHGEVSARQHAAALGELYLTLNATGRQHFLQILASRFSIDRERARQAARQLSEQEDDALFTQQVRELQEAVIAPREQLLRQFNTLPQGVKFLIDMRADLLGCRQASPDLQSLDNDLKQLLATWFDVGFLRVERITWQSPANLLEKLMAYEAVHAISSWRDLHHRLESDRHCYAFFHPGMPDEPLIFIEVALVKGLAASIQSLLDEARPDVDPAKADTAIFYSISNTQAGLKGISFGPFLIKKVVDSLRASLPNLKTFATLSPIPGFRQWLDAALAEESLEDVAVLKRALEEVAAQLGVTPTLTAVLEALTLSGDPDDAGDALKGPMLGLCARYLHERRQKDGVPLDPVARFHLGNGARIEQINWRGDLSGKGLRESYSLMVNYHYRLDEMNQNIEAYSTEKQIASAARVRNLLQEDSPSLTKLASLRRFLPDSRDSEVS